MRLHQGPFQPAAATLICVLAAVLSSPEAGPAQVPEGWRDAELVFHTFSIAAVDAETGEVGVAVTTRNACVWNGVPWVRAGVGAVATQASTRTEYGAELLDRLQAGETASQALERALAND